MEQRLSLDIVKVTEAAAIAAARLMGKGDKDGADHLAVEAMRKTLGELEIHGRIVIGEGERDEAPMLYIGEEVGSGKGAAVDIAVDPLEGTNLTAYGQPNSIAVMAVTERNGLLHAPDTYMEKLVVRGNAAGKVDIRASVKENLNAIAKAEGMKVEELTVIILDRPRHAELIQQVRDAGARIRLISDGDVLAAIASMVEGTNIHALMGIGGAPEGVLAAAAARCLGGEIQARMRWRSEEEKGRAIKMGVDISEEKVYFTKDLAPAENIIFSATGVTSGDLLKGVTFFGGGSRTSSLVMTAKTRQVRFIDTVHMADGPQVVRLK